MFFPMKGSRGNQIVVQMRTNGGGQGLALLLVCYVCVSHGAGGGVNLSMWEGGGREPLLTAPQLKLRRDQWAEHGGAYSAADAEVAAAAVDYGLKQAEAARPRTQSNKSKKAGPRCHASSTTRSAD
jgi:hypothetical protein